MDDYDWNILSDAQDKAKAELATLRAENERLRVALVTISERQDYRLPSAADIAKEALK